MIAPKVMSGSYDFFIWVGPGHKKMQLHFGENPDHILDTKNPQFSKYPPLQACPI